VFAVLVFASMLCRSWEEHGMAAHALVPDVHMTEAEYLASDFEIDPDFVEGYLEERSIGGIEHTNWQRALMLWFSQSTSLIAATEVTVRVGEGRYRVADLAVFEEAPQGAVVTSAPLCVVEILSPSDTFARLKGRMRDYERMGVRNLFVIESRTDLSVFRDGKFVPVTTKESPLEGSDVVLDWSAAAALLWPNPL
jgi:Uma2 family endonuclease